MGVSRFCKVVNSPAFRIHSRQVKNPLNGRRSDFSTRSGALVSSLGLLNLARIFVLSDRSPSKGSRSLSYFARAIM